MGTIRLFGQLSLERDGAVEHRFRYQKAASLLAYLALHLGQYQTREALAELLWPDEAPAVSRNRLRVVLTSLRHQLEPPGVAPGSVLESLGHQSVRLNPARITTDLAAVEAALRRGDGAAVRAHARGPLLPGLYDDWAVLERERLAARVAPFFEGDDAPAPPPPPIPRRADVDLPVPLTRFFGREDEIVQLQSLLDRRRLVTLHGPGGAGKTRLALEAARQAADRFDAVCFVAAAECHDPVDLAERLRGALRLPANGADPLAATIERLRDTRTLLVIDNYEQLVAAGGSRVAEAILSGAPRTVCLVTSRRLLGIDGEQALPLAALPVPDPDDDLEGAARSPSVALFVDRASALFPDFALTPANLGPIRDICRRLEGIPLALELAASRLRVLSPSRLRDSLDDRFSVLVRTDRHAGKDGRFRSLRLAIDWSWRLLPTDQQRAYAALSVFRGGFTAERAGQVCAIADPLPLLEALQCDALLERTPSDDDAPPRFALLETLREFAAEQVPERERDALARRHADVFLNWFEAWEELRFHMAVTPLARWIAPVVPEMPNLDAALDTLAAAPDASRDEARLCAALAFVNQYRARLDANEARFVRALARHTTPDAVRGMLLYRAGYCADSLGRHALARERYDECLRLFETLDSPEGLALAWNGLGNHAVAVDDRAAARAAYLRAVEIGRPIPVPRFPNSRAYWGIPASNVCGVLIDDGEYERAEGLLRDLHARNVADGIRHATGTLALLARVTGLLGRGDDSRALWREFLGEAAELEMRPAIAEALEALAELDRDPALWATAQKVRRDSGAEARTHPTLPPVAPRPLDTTLAALGVPIGKRPG